ncbi:pectin lyase-like protein [Penicillium taxi]|uniref:pectin lyase-like protein n=1 Tax=Penicillium taxi TaxID=168475 RepID=UPI0025455905|nr:pectin lyase-like protein [Penicillium taxi]KAJ5909225.1 pectin lyase-like protein [Penicillium taxi]
MPGTYTEQISVNRKGKVTLRGMTSFSNDFTKNSVTIENANGVSIQTGDDEKTPIIKIQNSNSDSSVALYNINFKNTFPQSTDTVALTADFSGFIAAYGCAFIGYQHTLFAKSGKQIFSNSYIEGSGDFIYGLSTVYLHQSYIATNTPGGSISAQGRSSATTDGGFVFDASLVTFTDSYGTRLGKTYLGRPMADYSRVIYMNSYLDGHLNAAGWTKWSPDAPHTKHVTFGEYNNSGPGQSSGSRSNFSTQLVEDQLGPFSLSNWIGDTSWLDMTAFSYTPSYSVENADLIIPVAPSTASSTGPSTGSSSESATGSATTTPTATSAAPAKGGHPSTGTKPPPGSALVSMSGAIDGSYSSLTSALASLPSDNTTQIIFIYPGTYNEQVPTIDRDGPVTIIGYTSKEPGRSFVGNEVTITFSAGISVTPVLSHTNGETATISTASKMIAMYNINVINTDNSDGSNPSYVTIAASVFGSHVGFYGCSFIGWKDTLLTGGALDYQYYESSYIEGAVDAITGPSKAYFKGCTLGAKGKNSALTAQGRGSPTAIGGYIFDQCLFDVAKNSKPGLKQSVYLGRPYSDYALVVVKNSYITDGINPSGWTLSSEDEHRVQHVTFAEYQNFGQGSWENNRDAREKFGHCELLSSDSYPLEKVMDSTDWIDMTYWDSIVTPSPSGKPGSFSATSPSSLSTDSTTSSQSAPPGTEVPASSVRSASSSSDETNTVTVVVTTSSTFLTTTIIASTTSTVQSTKSLDITLDAVTTTTTKQSREITTVTITKPTTKTRSLTKTVDASFILTPTPITETKTVNGKQVFKTVTAEKATEVVTDKTSTTKFITKLSKVTSTQTVTRTSIKTPITQETTIVTSTITVTIGLGGSIIKPGTETTIYSGTTVTETSTSRITTTLSCLPALRVVPRDIEIANVAAKTTHTEYSTRLKTSTVTLTASMTFITTTTTKTITHAPTTITNTETLVATQTSSVTISQGTVYTTITSTFSKSILKTLIPSTSTLTATAADSTTTTTVAGLVETTTDHTTITVESTANAAVSTVMDTKTTVFQSTIPLPVLTSTKIETTIFSSTPSVTITYHATSTKTTTVKITSTTISTVTKTASEATACTA